MMYFLALGQTGSLWETAAYAGSQYGIANPTEDDIRRVIEAIAHGQQDLSILSDDADDETYIQAASGARNRLLLEYQDGSLDAHYAAIDADLSAERVINAFLSFQRGETSWKLEFVWQKMSL